MTANVCSYRSEDAVHGSLAARRPAEWDSQAATSGLEFSAGDRGLTPACTVANRTRLQSSTGTALQGPMQLKVRVSTYPTFLVNEDIQFDEAS